MEKLIQIKKVSKHFGNGKNKIQALKNVSFDVFKGQNISLVGANGAGKTTLVEILAQLNKPSSGKIIYNLGTEKPINELIGIQFQDSMYPNGLSVKGIIKFVIDAYNSNISKDELKDMIKIFGVESFYKKNARSLSGGQSQRLNILLAFLHKPKVVFLDELSTGLDITIRTEIKKFIKEYATKNNINIILVSHDMGEIEYLTDRIIAMQHGSVVKDILIKDIKKKKISVEQFVTKYITH